VRQLASLVGPGRHTVVLASEATRHAWSLGAAEQLVLQMLVTDRRMKRVFEIGTFNGATTALIAECLPDDGEVTTVDLPDDAFAASQRPDQFSAQDVGAVHRRSEVSHKVTQLRVDSLAFDVGPWTSWADLVLVDGAHDYEHGLADTRSALTIVRPGGLIVWDDFEPYWHGLVHGVLDAAPAGTVERLAGLPLAVMTADTN
jgi:predicted O-methyltransferase YrrM